MTIHDRVDFRADQTFHSVLSQSSLPFSMQPGKPSRTTISDTSIIVTAVSCLAGLVLVIGIAILVSVLTKAPPASTVAAIESVQEKSEEDSGRTYFLEGYTMVVPTGFQPETREVTEDGVIVYRFHSDDGCRFTVAIVQDDSIERFTTPPNDFSQTLVKGVDELSEDIDGEVDPMRVWVDSMPASLFRFYEKETFRGVRFTYCMVVMDRGRQLFLKIAGKYGGYSEHDEYIEMPEHWYDALMTLRHVRRDEEPNDSWQTEEEQLKEQPGTAIPDRNATDLSN